MRTYKHCFPCFSLFVCSYVHRLSKYFEVSESWKSCGRPAGFISTTRGIYRSWWCPTMGKTTISFILLPHCHTSRTPMCKLVYKEVYTSTQIIFETSTTKPAKPANRNIIQTHTQKPSKAINKSRTKSSSLCNIYSNLSKPTLANLLSKSNVFRSTLSDDMNN